MTTPRVEIRVPVSPTREFAWMLSVLHRSLELHGGLDDVRMTAMIGASDKERAASELMLEWLAPRIDGVIVGADSFEEHGIHGTTSLRVTKPSDADVVIMMDSDMIVSGSIADVCADVAASPCVAGTIAHGAPFMQVEDWVRVYREAGLAAPDFPYRYSGWPYMQPSVMRPRPDSPKCPPYFNYAFVVMTSGVLDAVGAHLTERVLAAATTPPRALRARLYTRLRHGMYRSQIALTLAIEHAQVAHRALGVRYNFGNDYRLEALHPAELAEARVIHLLRRDQGFDKSQIFGGIESLREFVASGWRSAGATEIGRQVVAEILPDLIELEPPSALAGTRWIW